jgi:prepilin-type N-terminal cleavage/methylation domain-containing protein
LKLRSAAMHPPSNKNLRHESDTIRVTRAFTLIELLVVIAIIGILAAILLPVLTAAKIRALQSECTNNKKQLITAWLIYAGDNQERLAINSDPHVFNTGFYPQGSTSPTWVSGILDWSLNSVNTNTSDLVNDQYSLLGDYLGNNPALFTCPADHYASPLQQLLGWHQRSRTVAMNGAIGDGYKYGNPGSPFGWTPWYVAKKTTDFHVPGPSDCWVIMDEHPDSIDDAVFYTPNVQSVGAVTMFPELPSNQLALGCGIAYADGHAEQHFWKGPILGQHINVSFTLVQRVPLQSTTDPDLNFLAAHTPLY